MHYLLFNDEIYLSDGQVVNKTERGTSLQGIENARLCYVDVDVMIASAPQDFVDQKDSLLAQKFEAAYSNEYITLNEKIDDNIFQVFGIKAQKVKEIYSLVPSFKIDAFVPYAIAIRCLLVNKKTDMTRIIVMVDDLGGEKLITVFDGLKFSRTRTIHTDKTQDILPDIKRSHMDFNKKLGEFAGKSATGDFTIITNNKPMAQDIKISEPGLAVDYLDCRYPALEGLKYTDTQIKYRVHEEIILERKNKESRSRLMHLIISICICTLGSLFFGFNQITCSYEYRQWKGEKLKNTGLKETLNNLDQQIYRNSLKELKYLDYSSVFFEVSGLLPGTYEISSFKFSCPEDRWIFETYIFARDDQFYDEIPRTKILKNAEIKDFFIKNRPGKYLKVVL